MYKSLSNTLASLTSFATPVNPHDRLFSTEMADKTIVLNSWIPSTDMQTPIIYDAYVTQLEGERRLFILLNVSCCFICS